MKKFIILVLLMFMLVPVGLCEDFPPRGGRDEYPIYWYLHDYAEALKKTMDKKRFFKFNTWKVEHVVKITRDGKVFPLYVKISDGKYYDNLTKKIILSNPPKPFGDDINLDSMTIGIYLVYDGWDDIVEVRCDRASEQKDCNYWLYIRKNP